MLVLEAICQDFSKMKNRGVALTFCFNYYFMAGYRHDGGLKTGGILLESGVQGDRMAALLRHQVLAEDITMKSVSYKKIY